MSKIAPVLPWDREIAPDLDLVIRGHEERLAKFRVNLEDPVITQEDADLMLRTLVSILAEVVLEGRGRKWAMVREHYFGIGGCIELQEAKTEARAQFMLHDSGFGLFLSLDRAPLIGRARDAFWTHILALADLGQLAYAPSAVPQALCGRGSSHVPVRPGYAINELMKYWHLLKQEGDSLVDFGSLEVAWPMDIPMRALVPVLSETLEAFYRISYELYRLDRPSRRSGSGQVDS